MITIRSGLALVTIWLLAHPALALALPGGAPGGGSPSAAGGGPPGGGDYRAKVYTACSLVFAAILGYLVLSFRQNAKLREELDFASRRIEELEKGAPGAPSRTRGAAGS